MGLSDILSISSQVLLFNFDGVGTSKKNRLWSLINRMACRLELKGDKFLIPRSLFESEASMQAHAEPGEFIETAYQIERLLYIASFFLALWLLLI